MAVDSTLALTTYATARDVIGLGNDDPNASQTHLERIINAVSEAMVKAAGRPFVRATVTAERHGSNGGPRLFLQRPPVISVSAVTIVGADGTTVDTTFASTDYYVENSEAGWLLMRGGWPCTAFAPGSGATDMVLPDDPEGAIRVTYVGGYITPEQVRLDGLEVSPLGLVRTLPYDLEDACLASVASVLRRSGQDRNVTSENTQTIAKTWRESSDMLTAETLKVCHRYARYI